MNDQKKKKYLVVKNETLSLPMFYCPLDKRHLTRSTGWVHILCGDLDLHGVIHQNEGNLKTRRRA